MLLSNVEKPKPTNKYPLRSSGILSKPYYRRENSKFTKSFRVRQIWNIIFAKTPLIADVQFPSMYETIIKTTVLNIVS